jgi:predicted O-methyltransferase YrrM
MLLEKCDVFNKFGNRNYFNAIYSILLKYRPQYCLEIGTNYGGSTKVFDKYLNDYQSDGLVVTTDIRQYVSFNSKHIIQKVVCPHINNSSQYHEVLDQYLLNNNGVDTIKNNIDIIKMSGINTFDLIFIDGDHNRKSVLADIEIAKSLSHKDTILLIDDINATNHEVSEVYKELCLQYEHYEFEEDWQEYVDLGIIYNIHPIKESC